MIPFKIGSSWNLITRTIIPLFAYQPDPTSSTNWAGGLGDINPTFLPVPQKATTLIWGVGPTFILPTATNSLLGQGKWSAGPSVVLLVQPGKWTLGTLANNVWSFAGENHHAIVNQFRPTAGEVWTVPFGLGLGRIQKLGKQPVNWSIAAFGNAIHPSYGPAWALRFQLALLYPKK